MMIRRFFLVGAPILLFLGLYLQDSSAVRWLELRSIDWRFAWRGSIAPTGDVVVVAIDDKSLAQEGHWPWSREKVAQLISMINQAQPAAIALDVIFAESDAGDAALAREIAAAKTVGLGYYFYQTPEELAAADFAPDVLQQSFESILPTAFPMRSTDTMPLIAATAAVANIPMLAQAAKYQGFFNAFPDSDGSVRRYPLMMRYRDHVFPSLALELLVAHESDFAPVLATTPLGELAGVSVGTRFIPTSALGEVFINYRGGSDSFKQISAHDVLSGSALSEGLRGKTVLVGATAVGIYDLRVTPVSSNFPGVLVGANVVDMLYRGDFLQRTMIARIWDGVALTLVAVLLGILLLRMRILYGVAATVILVGAYGVATQLWFNLGLVMALATPPLEWITLMGAITIYRGLTEERQKRQIRRAFRAYLHPKIVEELTDHPERLKLGGDRATCTMLFCDVKNFSTISEKMSPDQLTKLMNTFFDPVCKAIMAEGGYVDKLIGDAVMAVFGAPVAFPDHASRACRAAITMQQVVCDLEPRVQKEFGVAEFKLRIGIHTGPVIVGNMGTKDRLNYTVMGDAVNLASRLEGANKEMGTSILLSQATVDAAGATISPQFVSTIQVKGKEEHVKVYTIGSDGVCNG